MSSYFEKYLKLINQDAGSKKSGTKKSTDDMSIEYSSDILRDILNITDVTKFKKKYGSGIDEIRDKTSVSGLCPLLVYLFNGGIDNSVIEFLFPSNLDLLFNKDSEGNIIFHRLVEQDNIDLLKEFYFRNIVLAEKIIKCKNKQGKTILELPNIKLNPILIGLFDLRLYDSNQRLWVTNKGLRVSRAAISVKPFIGDYDGTKQKSTKKNKIHEKPKGKGRRIVSSDLTNNLIELGKLMSGNKKKSDGSQLYGNILAKNIINDYISSYKITQINILYLVKRHDINETQQIDEEIPTDWIIDEIRFVESLNYSVLANIPTIATLPDGSTVPVFIIELMYDIDE